MKKLKPLKLYQYVAFEMQMFQVCPKLPPPSPLSAKKYNGQATRLHHIYTVLLNIQYTINKTRQKHLNNFDTTQRAGSPTFYNNHNETA